MRATITMIPSIHPLTGAAVWLLGPEATEPAVNRNRRVARNADCGLCNWQLAKVLRFIEENLEARIQVDDLCGLVRLGASRFSTCFRISTGQSPYQYILSRRIDRAKRMLATTEAPLCQIALASGLCDQSHLSNMFKRMVGVTPLVWRRRQWHGEIRMTPPGYRDCIESGPRRRAPDHLSLELQLREGYPPSATRQDA